MGEHAAQEQGRRHGVDNRVMEGEHQLATSRSLAARDVAAAQERRAPRVEGVAELVLYLAPPGFLAGPLDLAYWNRRAILVELEAGPAPGHRDAAPEERVPALESPERRRQRVLREPLGKAQAEHEVERMYLTGEKLSALEVAERSGLPRAHQLDNMSAAPIVGHPVGQRGHHTSVEKIGLLRKETGSK